MRDRVNVPIDSKLKRLFEDLQQRHEKSWTEVLEKGVRELLIETDPVQILESEIKIEEEKQEERRQALIRAKANVSILEIELGQEKSSKKNEEILQKKRIEKIGIDFKTYAQQWKYGSDHVNWSRIIDFGEFKDMKEAKKWLEKELKERGIMEKYVHYQ
jgi:allophanate hydrolase subunit 1